MGGVPDSSWRRACREPPPGTVSEIISTFRDICGTGSHDPRSHRMRRFIRRFAGAVVLPLVGGMLAVRGPGVAYPVPETHAGRVPARAGPVPGCGVDPPTPVGEV